MLSGRPFVVGVADFGVTHLVRDFHTLVDDLFDTAQCRRIGSAIVFCESLFESLSALEGILPTVIEGRGILLQQLGYLERIVAPTGSVFRIVVQIRSSVQATVAFGAGVRTRAIAGVVIVIATRSSGETCKGHSHQEQG